MIRKYFTNHITREQNSPNQISISGLSKTGGYILFFIIFIETSLPIFSYFLNLQFSFDLTFYITCSITILVILFGFRFSIVITQELAVFYDQFLFIRMPRIKGSSKKVEIYGWLTPKNKSQTNEVFVSWEDDGGWEGAFESEWLEIKSEEKAINLGNQKSTPQILQELVNSLTSLHPNEYERVKNR